MSPMQQMFLGLGAGPVEYTASNATDINLQTCLLYTSDAADDL